MYTKPSKYCTGAYPINKFVKKSYNPVEIRTQQML